MIRKCLMVFTAILLSGLSYAVTASELAINSSRQVSDVNQPPTFIPQRVLASYRGCQQAINPPMGMTILTHSCLTSSNTRLVTYRLKTMTVSAAVEQLKQQVGIVSAQPDFYYEMAGSDTDYTRQMMRLANISSSYNGAGITVGLIDSLVDTAHKDLKNANITQYNLFDFKRKGAHATAISGILLGAGKVQGIAPKIHLISIPAFYTDKKNRRVSNTSRIIRALEKMEQQDIQLLNLSFVGHRDRIILSHIRNLQKKGVIVVAAAGNDSGKSRQIYPAGYLMVVGVTAIDKDKRLYKKATTGRHVDYAAPGVKLLALAPNNRYQKISGTSYATAYVTGLLALLVQQYKDSDTALRMLETHTEDLGEAGKDKQFGYGLVKAP